MIKHYLAQWNIMRLLRLIMGIIIIVQGVKAEMWLIVALGILFQSCPYSIWVARQMDLARFNLKVEKINFCFFKTR